MIQFFKNCDFLFLAIEIDRNDGNSTTDKTLDPTLPHALHLHVLTSTC